MNNTVTRECADIRNPDCLDSISYLYDLDGSNALSRRFVSLYAAKAIFRSVVVFIIAFLTAQWYGRSAEHGNGVPHQLHIDDGNLRDIESIPDADVLALATASTDPSPVLIVLTPTPSNPIPFPTVTSSPSSSLADQSVSQCADSALPTESLSSCYNASDIITVRGQDGICTVPAEDEATLNQLLNAMGTCPTLQPDTVPRKILKKRQLTDIITCLLGQAQYVVEALALDQPLNQLLGLALAVKMLSPPAKFA